MTLTFLRHGFWLKLVHVSALVLFPEVINADVGTGSRENEATKITVPVCTLQLWDASVPVIFLGRAKHRASRLEEIRVCQDDLGMAGPERPPHCYGMCFCVIFSLASWFDLSVSKWSAIYSGPCFGSSQLDAAD